jgi:hypothetical protein
MRSVRLVLGVLFILSGMVLGIWVTLHYFSEGISAIRDGRIAHGAVLLVVWSEIFGIASMLALVFPGVLVLKNLGPSPAKLPDAYGGPRGN